MDFVHVGKTKDLNGRMNSHQHGHSSLSSQPEHLRPCDYFIYMCGLYRNETMMFHIERK